MKKEIVLTVKSVVLFFSLGLLLVSCGSEPKEIEKAILLEKLTFTAEDSLVDRYARTKGDAHGGSYFSRTDTTNQYGIGTKYSISDTCLNQDFRIKINLWVRSNKPAPDCVYAIGLYDGANLLLWSEVKMDKYVTEANKWVNVVDSLTLPGNLITKPGLVFTAFTFNTKKDVTFDSDDLELSMITIRKEIEE